ncbi:serine/threonine-protein kinase [Sabulicella rubraurantiaca]|uniref:hypothetical protein n=1 Tax=Sabulicella rubraurantiaca TaxID=2811429 RepID=UPI001A968FB8|nr:hypothetical protein [Sabulicella rubraurantiaca]
MFEPEAVLSNHHEAIASPAIEPPREAWFSPHRTLGGDSGEAFRTALEALLDSLERSHGGRVRARRKTAVESWKRVLGALGAGLATTVVGGYLEGLALSLANPQRAAKVSRYEPSPLPPEMLRTAADLLVAGEYIVRTPGRPGRLSTLAPTPLFAALVEAHGVTLEDVETVEGDEVIHLRGYNPNKGERGPSIEYVDTPATYAMRRQMVTLNAWLRDAPLDVAPGGPWVDTGRRSMIRVFNRAPPGVPSSPDFTLGGRLAGGFWINMKRDDRLSRLRIEGAPVAFVDWSSAWPRIAFAMAGQEPPEGDLYAGLPGTREGAKMVVNALLSSYKALSRFPQDTRVHFASRDRWPDIQRRIFDALPPVARVAGTGFNLKAQRVESDALLLALGDFQRLGVVALPQHDAVAVGMHHVETAKEVMVSAFRRVVGVEGAVKVETHC